MYLLIDKFFKRIETRDVYTIPKEISKKYIDDRKDPIGELAKLYYYMIPIITHGSYLMNAFINESFYIAYEFNPTDRTIIDENLFFMLPRNNETFNQNDNFTPNNILLNPLINITHFEHTELKSNSYYNENWFMKQDNHFR